MPQFFRLCILFMLLGVLSGCGSNTSPLDVMRGLLGYTPPPPKTTVGEELNAEFARCKKIDPNRNCAQIAYDVVRKVKGLEPRKVPEGVVIILEGDGGHLSEKEKSEKIDERLQSQAESKKESNNP